MCFLVFPRSLWFSYWFFLIDQWEDQFCLIGSGFLEVKFFRLLLIVFSGRIGDLCEFYFMGNFVFFWRSALCLSGRFCVCDNFSF